MKNAKRVSFIFMLAVGLAAGICLNAGAQELSLSTNLADYAAGGTLNIGAAYGFSRHWTLNAQARYNPFSFGEGSEEVMQKQRTVAAHEQIAQSDGNDEINPRETYLRARLLVLLILICFLVIAHNQSRLGML